MSVKTFTLNGNLVSAGESRLATRDSLEVGGQTIRAETGAVAPREIWWLYVLGAAALILLEWTVYALRSRV